MQRLTGHTGKNAHLSAEVDRWANPDLGVDSHPSALKYNISISVKWHNGPFSTHRYCALHCFCVMNLNFKYDAVCQHMPDEVFPKIAISRRAVLSTVIIHLTKCTKGGWKHKDVGIKWKYQMIGPN